MPEFVEHVGPDGEVSRLPSGERVLWSGAPDQRALARHLLRERWVLAFVAGSFCLGAADALQHEQGAAARLIGVATLSLILVTVALVSIRLFAWRLAKSSSYVVTNRRVFFNIGIVLRADANVPFSSIETVDLRRHADGSGDLMVTLSDAQEIPWLLLFPHMTWRGSRRGRPTFLALREPQLAADAVVGALRAYALAGDAAVVAATPETITGTTRSLVGTPTPSPA